LSQQIIQQQSQTHVKELAQDLYHSTSLDCRSLGCVSILFASL